MAIDWESARSEYLTTGISMRALAEKNGISVFALRKRACAEQWTELRKQYGGHPVKKAKRTPENGAHRNTLREDRYEAQAQCQSPPYGAIADSTTPPMQANKGNRSGADKERMATLARITAKSASFLEKRLDLLMTAEEKANEVKAIMETARIIHEMYKGLADAGGETEHSALVDAIRKVVRADADKRAERKAV